MTQPLPGEAGPVTDVDCSVAIVGAGPAGATMANLLGEAGVSVVLLDQATEIIDHPRAVGIDDEAIRTLQSVGLAEVVLESALQNAPIRYYDSRGKVLAHVAPSARPYGWPRRNLFYQPFLERSLRDNLDRYPGVQVRLGQTVTGLEQDSHGVTLQVEGGPSLRARYVVGADGGRSQVREEIGVALLGDTAPVKWLVVDVEKDTWDAPYSAVYTSPERPAMTIPLPFGHRRFEFQIQEDEDPDTFAESANVSVLLKRFYPDTPVPPVVRSRVYWHHSRTAASFQVGRVFLVGDAAHLQPPFFGQGMNSGFRDVTNLAWKLAAVVDGRADANLLATYDSERRRAADDMVQFATRMGRMYKPRSLVTERVRNTLFRGVQKVPGGRDYILQMKYKPAPRYTDGFVLPSSDKDALVGRPFPQPFVTDDKGTRRRLDDVLGPRLAVLGLVAGALSGLPAELLDRLTAAGGVAARSAAPGVYQRYSGGDSARDSLPDGVVEVIDIDGGLRDLHLSRPQDEVYVIRPDRYVAAACGRDGIEAVLRRLLATLRA
ncbi:MAG: putative 3-(3-hydroxyphenyl)propionate hydroxylase [Frankiales bacterium]|nr:putative 3-(3-hydroxyphenyl)propionate hydroxylase [Frankiales bacterium]